MDFRDLIPSILKSTALHLAVGVALLVSVDFQDDEPKVLQVNLNSNKPELEEKKAVEAISIAQQAVEKRIKQLKNDAATKKRQEEQRIKKLENRAANAKKQREAEARRIVKLEKQRKAKQREKEKADAEAKKAKKKQEIAQDKANKANNAATIAANKRKKEEEALKKAEALRIKNEKEAKRVAAIKKQQAEEARRKALEEKLMQEQLAQEQAIRAKARQQQVLTEVDKYTALITARIQQNLLIDEKMKGKQCRLNVRLAFNGLVTKVEPLDGEKLVCEAAIRAVRMADTLPVSKDKDVFEQMKNINLIIKPEF